MADPAVIATGRTDDADRGALTHLPSHLRLWGVAVAMVAIDLWSKNWAFTRLRPNEIRPIIAGTIDFRRSLNDGAVFGSFTGYTEVFILASLLALGFVLYLFAHSRARQPALHVALALILAGAIGNLYDRAFIKADVVRFPRPGGQVGSHVGRLFSGPDADPVLIGDWPDGTNARPYDRDKVSIRRQGVVRDFIKFVPRLPKWVPRVGGNDVWPWVFNVADAALVCGVGLLLLHSLFDRRRD